MDIVGADYVKRMKFDDENALNLSLAALESLPVTPSLQSNTQLTEMRERFQQWVIETYRDSSKTKTITRKKYDRIIKTLAGEIKNCAENSKFRFWMKCKNFKLIEVQPPAGEKLLLVQDKKGDDIKYKKVAVVENFFDIIYNVHVNEGARGIQHAGQKRTHRTITETYAFLPREAVTKFLLCCAECQKRTHDERKTSPNSSSCDSIHEDRPVVSQSVRPPVAERSAQVPLDFSATCREYDSGNDWKPDYDNNNYDQPFNFCTKRLMPVLCSSDLTRKRKRRFTRKIIRPVVVDGVQDVKLGAAHNVSNDEGQRLIGAEDYRIVEGYDYSTTRTNAFRSPDPAFVNADQPEDSQRYKTESSGNENEPPPNFGAGNASGCPYLSRLSEVLYDPIKFAEESERHLNPTSLNEEFLEQLAVNLIAKARRLEAVKNVLTDHERHQLSLKVYSCRISSFLLNYAADLILKTVVAD